MPTAAAPMVRKRARGVSVAVRRCGARGATSARVRALTRSARSVPPPVRRSLSHPSSKNPCAPASKQPNQVRGHGSRRHANLLSKAGDAKRTPRPRNLKQMHFEVVVLPGESPRWARGRQMYPPHRLRGSAARSHHPPPATAPRKAGARCRRPQPRSLATHSLRRRLRAPPLPTPKAR